MSVTINGSSGLVFADNTAQTTAATCGLVNKIINGRMEIDQRNAGASVTPINGQFSVDRFACNLSQASKYSAQQSSVAPAGFTNSLLITSLSSYSVGANDYFLIRQTIEGTNIADLNWGSANASAVTLSFWIRSSLTGTFGGALENSDSTRCYPFSYTINSANTWEQKSITIAGDTTGTWLTNTNRGIKVTFSLGMGSNLSGTANAWVGSEKVSVTGATSVVGTNGATFYITGVDLRKGSAGATSQTMDVRPYGTELALCQRYYQAMYGGSTGLPLYVSSYNTAGNGIGNIISFKVSMRAAPTGTIVGTWDVSNTAQPSINGATTEQAVLLSTVSGTGVGYFFAGSTSKGLTLSAEL